MADGLMNFFNNYRTAYNLGGGSASRGFAMQAQMEAQRQAAEQERRRQQMEQIQQLQGADLYHRQQQAKQQHPGAVAQDTRPAYQQSIDALRAQGVDPSVIAQVEQGHKRAGELYELGRQRPETVPGTFGYMDEQKRIRDRQLGLDGGTGRPSSVREWEYYQSLSPEKQQEYLQMKRSDPRNRFLDTGQYFQNPRTGERIQITPGPEQDPGFKAEQARQVEKAKEEGKRQAQIDAGRDQILESLTLLDQLNTHPGFDGVIGNITGPVRAMIPGSPEHDFMALVDQIVARNFLEGMQGVSLGAVSKEEQKAVQDARSTLGKTGQSPKAYREAIQTLMNALTDKIGEARRRARQPGEADPLKLGDDE